MALKILLIFTSLMFIGCNRGLDVESIALPKNMVEDAATAFFKADDYGLLEQYASLEKGVTVADNFIVDEESDASMLELAMRGENNRHFIQIPPEGPKADHLMRALSSAAIRRKSLFNQHGAIKYLNLEDAKKSVESFNFNDESYKKYLLGVARRINDSSLSSDDIIVNIDYLPRSLPSKEFFAELTKPGIIAISSKSAANAAIFANDKITPELSLRGLNPGQSYQLVKHHLDKTAGMHNGTVAKEMALKIAKTLTVIDPYGGLGGMVGLFKSIDGVAETSPLPPDYDKKIIENVTLNLKSNYKFIENDLKINSLKLSEIFNIIKNNRSSYHEELYKITSMFESALNSSSILQQIRASLGAIRIEDVPSVLKKLSITVDELGQLRYSDLPKMQQDLVGTATVLQEELKNKTTSEIRGAESRLIKQNEDQHKATRSDARKSMDDIVGRSQVEILANMAQKITSAEQILQDAITNARKRIIAQNQSDIKGINEHTSERIKKARQLLSDAIAQAQSAINTNTDAQGHQTREEIIANQQKSVGQAKTEISAHTSEKLAETRKALSSHTAGVVQNAQGALKENIEGSKTELAGLMQDELARAIKKIIGQNKGDLKGATENTSEIIKRAQKLLTDAIVQAQSIITGNVESQGQQTRVEIVANQQKVVGQAKAEVTAHTSEKLTQLHKALSSHTTGVVQNAQSALKENIEGSKTELGALMQDELGQAIKKIMARNQVEFKGLHEGINKNTDERVKKAQQLLTDAIAQAQSVITGNTGSQGQQTRGEIIAHQQKVAGQTKTDVTTHTSEKLSQLQKALSSHTTGAVQNAQGALKENIDSSKTELAGLVQDELARAVKKILGQNLGDLKGINENTNESIKKARQLLNDAIVQAQGIITGDTAVQGQKTRDEIIAHQQKVAGQTKTDVTTHTSEKLSQLQKALNSHTTGAVQDAQGALKENIEGSKTELGRLVQDELAQAIKKILGQNQVEFKGLSEINNNTDERVKKAQQLLSDAIIQAQGVITGNTEAQGQKTRDEIIANQQKSLGQAKTEVTAHTSEKLSQLQKALSSHTTGAVQDAQSGLKENIAGSETKLSAMVQNELAQAIKKIIGDNQSGIKNLEGINRTTDDRVKKAQQLLSDAIVQAQENLKATTKEEGSATREELGRKNKDDLSSLRTGLEGFIADKHAGTKKDINKHTSTKIDEANSALMAELEGKFSGIVQATKDKIDAVMKNIVASTATKVDKAASDINEVVKAEGKAGRSLTSEEVNRAREEVKGIVEQAVEQISAEVRKNPKVNRANTAELLRKVTEVISEHVHGQFTQLYADLTSLSFHLNEYFNELYTNLTLKDDKKIPPTQLKLNIVIAPAGALDKKEVEEIKTAPNPDAPAEWLSPWNTALTNLDQTLATLVVETPAKFEASTYGPSLHKLNQDILTLQDEAKSQTLAPPKAQALKDILSLWNHDQFFQRLKKEVSQMANISEDSLDDLAWLREKIKVLNERSLPQN